jgi:hypothetical protein
MEMPDDFEAVQMDLPNQKRMRIVDKQLVLLLLNSSAAAVFLSHESPYQLC